MKVLILANVNSSHTQKWCLGLQQAGLEVALFSINPSNAGNDWYKYLPVSYISRRGRGNPFRYVPLYFKLKSFIREFRPDVLHSHFITNYTLLGNLAGFPRHVATAWGSDVFRFPRQGLLNKWVLTYNLRKPAALISTSECMAREMKRYTSREVHVIPFGVDPAKFQRAPSGKNGADLTIACFKHLEPVYAPDVLLKAFALVCRAMPGAPLRLLLAGEGSMRAQLERQALHAGVQDRVVFTGWLKPDQVPALLKSATACVYLSKEESFGVSLLEAMACRVALVVTPTEGFVEVAGEQGAALFCPFNDPQAAADQITRLLTDAKLYATLTETAYSRVMERYNLHQNIRQQIALYELLPGK